ncbi:MAG: hypothetical protein DKM22_04135 [Candidatus Melainabacteria bacterium]|nr:MAG: hypothetical protein DKM22_04135 [Candidatus Melainabacteria bacterium]
MNSEYFINSLLNYLEDKLPAELFLEVQNYITNDTIDGAEKMTQAERVYNHLKEHGFITNMQCHLLYGIRHCPSVIRDIKKKLLYEGSLFYIDTEPQKGCDRYGNKVNWVKYLLKEKSLCVNLQ